MKALNSTTESDKGIGGAPSVIQDGVTNVHEETANPRGGLPSPDLNRPGTSPAAPTTAINCKSVTLGESEPCSTPKTGYRQKQFKPRSGPTVTVNRAAKLLGVASRTLYRWESEGKMPPRVRYMGRNQWHLSDIQEMAGRLREKLMTDGGVL